jgi:hypothetical protein
MKKLAYTIFAVLLVIATGAFKAQAQQSRPVSGFNSIASGGPFDVHVKIDGTESLKINASAEIINEIETKVEDGTLHIKFKHHNDNWNHDDYGKIDIYVTAKSLSALSNAGSGNIHVDGSLSGNDVSVSLSGSGNISTAVKSGNFHASISGSGNIHLNGNAGDTKINIAGSGELDAKGFKTGSASVSIAGSGSAYLNAEKTIGARIVGSGNVVYSGSATISESKTVGSGSISRAD